MKTPEMQQIEECGWVLLPHCYSTPRLESLQIAVAELAASSAAAVRQKEGAVYAARNVLELCPQIIQLWQTDRLVACLREVLGPRAGLVRALFFDKPPAQTWALPWHKDRLIAVSSGRGAPGYSRPRNRAGILHCEPPVEVLEQMLTLRIHLDPMTPENGPLEVLSGSHRTGKTLSVTGFTPTQITSAAGDVFLMRPLLAHASGRSSPTCALHRRVLHLEFSGQPELSEGHHWHTFLPLKESI